MPDPEPVVPSHPLQNSWCIWEHEASKNSSDWGSNMTSLGEFNTVEDFWRFYNNIPKPSQVFFDGKSRKRVGDRQIESFSIFKKGIRPEWEDPANARGGEWSCRERLQPIVLDTLWESLVLGLIGETIDWADEICGARVVDKSRGKDTYYRFELWLRAREPGTTARLKERLLSCLADGNPSTKGLPDFSFKDH
ncbi:eukaryotic translation initiation factor 4E-like 1 [Tribonema minus]|uniref:Eukaryotic translation initiation factor 4E-like 1 n=1 Tax=Tribonema minus TaxID=303371 RepID=A0A835ZBP0_9STRA|nr:eukaryotic translation initiation factor 4E-like 1 [Tribonema minus]